MSQKYQPGDIFFTQSQTWLGRAIRFFSRSGGESRTMVNHVGIIVRPGWSLRTSGSLVLTAEDIDRVELYSSIAVEALQSVQKHSIQDEYAAKNNKIAVFRAKHLSAEEKDQIVRKAESYVGRKYGYLKIATHLADWFLGGRFIFRRLTQSDNYPICSWLVAHAYKDCNIHFGVEAGAATPDDMWDFCQASPDKFECIRELK
jgi:cell wall-associated NlpC family hydrolase